MYSGSCYSAAATSVADDASLKKLCDVLCLPQSQKKNVHRSPWHALDACSCLQDVWETCLTSKPHQTSAARQRNCKGLAISSEEMCSFPPKRPSFSQQDMAGMQTPLHRSVTAGALSPDDNSGKKPANCLQRPITARS